MIIRLMPLCATLLSILAPQVACGGTISMAPPQGGDARDEALEYYRQLYPVSREIRDIAEEWSIWNATASQEEYDRLLYSKSRSAETRLRFLHNSIVTLYAPSGLRDLKDYVVTATTNGIGGFTLAREYAITGNANYQITADSAHPEFNRLMGFAADEWDDGLADYRINPAEATQ